MQHEGLLAMSTIRENVPLLPEVRLIRPVCPRVSEVPLSCPVLLIDHGIAVHMDLFIDASLGADPLICRYVSSTSVLGGRYVITKNALALPFVLIAMR